MYNRVTVIGLGTLGGFLCKNISDLDCVKELIIVDHDVVEGKNVFSSIYNSTHIGEYKVNALVELINDDVAVTTINEEYIEGITFIPKSDLVIDCRDIVCNRKTEIDVRFYISDRILIIDCRKNVFNKQRYDGLYSLTLSKSEINKAAFFASQIIESGEIKNMIVNNLIQRIDLNIISSIMNKSIRKSLNNKIDMIYESGNTQRLQCIEENVNPILNLNKQQDVKVFVGERTKALEKNINKIPVIGASKYAVIPKSSLNNPLDVIQALSNIVNLQDGVSNFIVTVRKRKGEEYVELIEETGAA